MTAKPPGAGGSGQPATRPHDPGDRGGLGEPHDLGELRDVGAFFAAVPRVDAVAAVPRVDAVARRSGLGRGGPLTGLAGRDAGHLALWLAGAMLLFLAYGGPAAFDAWSASSGVLAARGVGSWVGDPGLAGWLATMGAASALGGFIVSTYLPRRGERVALSPCGAMPLLWTVMLPLVWSPAEPLTGALGVGMLVLFAIQRATGAGCAV